MPSPRAFPAPPPPLGSFDADDEVNGRGRRMRNRLLVLVAVVVIAGGAAWAWISSHRAPEGPVPVIAADTSPEKVKRTCGKRTSMPTSTSAWRPSV